VLICTPGQAGDSPTLPLLLGELRVPRPGPGRPRSTPTALLADKAYSARAHRALLRERGITTVIPERADQIGHRRRRGSAGGRPVTFNTETYKARNVVERAFNHIKQWRGLATRYDDHVLIYRGALVLHSIIRWLNELRDTTWSAGQNVGRKSPHVPTNPLDVRPNNGPDLVFLCRADRI
jgi:transposase